VAAFHALIPASEFQSTAAAGWTRPWVASGTCTVTLGQQIMAQVAGQLKGHIGQIENTFKELVAHSTLSKDDKHRLFVPNRGHRWWTKGPVPSPILEELTMPEATLKWARQIFRRALAQHARPNFKQYHPQIGKRSVVLKAATDVTHFPLWATIATVTPGQRIALPVHAWPKLMATIAATSTALAPLAAHERQLRRARAAAQRQAAGRPAAASGRAPRQADLCSLPQTLRLILRPSEPGQRSARSHRHGVNPPSVAASGMTLSLGLVVDHRGWRAAQRAACRPIPGKTVAFDLGGAVLMATSDGGLPGRHWFD